MWKQFSFQLGIRPIQMGVGQQSGTFKGFCVVFERCRQGAVSRSDSLARNPASLLGAMGLIGTFSVRETLGLGMANCRSKKTGLQDQLKR